MSGTVSSSGGGSPLAGLQNDAMGQYEQEEAQEIEFSMKMQTQQTIGKEADKAAGAQVGG